MCAGFGDTEERADFDPDAEQLMAPPIDPDKIKALMKNPYAAEMLSNDIELLKLKKQRKEEEE